MLASLVPSRLFAPPLTRLVLGYHFSVKSCPYFKALGMGDNRPSLSQQGAATQGAPPLLLIDLSKPRYDQGTYVGRAKHFFETANPINIFVTRKKLEEAARLVIQYKKNNEAPPGTTEEQLWRAKRMYDSAYHPDTGQKMFIIGRMSAQVPMNMTIVGCMMTFYKSPAAVVFWQWMNQSFNAIVNYTNRSGDEIIPAKEIAVPYVAATTAATLTALGLNQVVAKRVPPLVCRFIPFAAVVAANGINIPLVRQRELKYGIPVMDKDDNKVGTSKRAAQKGIAQVVFSRVIMAMPAMVIPPFIMDPMERRGVFKRMPWLNAPMQICLVGLCLVFATPLCCAIFPQKSSISVSRLEPDVQDSIRRTSLQLKTVYFNKGL